MANLFLNVSKEWQSILICKEFQEAVSKVYKITKEENLICPPQSKWFEWARLTQLNDIKVIIVGQDPYPTAGVAHGLSFSSNSSIQPSLKNIYKCLFQSNLIEKIPKTAHLGSWAKQGVLLLNAALTTEIGKAGHHTKAWLPYTSYILKKISDYGKKNNTPFYFMLWGVKAQNTMGYIDCEYHHILLWGHPSPLAQHGPKEKQFVNCNHFIKCKFINWNSVNMETVIEEKMETQAELDPQVVKYYNHPKCIHVFTDGSCVGNGTRKAFAGFAALFVKGPLKDISIRSSLKPNSQNTPSNIRAEGLAIIAALEKLVDIDTNIWNKCCIYTDCEFWINMLQTFMPNWSELDFVKKANSDITTRLWDLWTCIELEKKEILLQFVPSHNKTHWEQSNDEIKQWCAKNNVLADKLANKARME